MLNTNNTETRRTSTDTVLVSLLLTPKTFIMCFFTGLKLSLFLGIQQVFQDQNSNNKR